MLFRSTLSPFQIAPALAAALLLSQFPSGPALADTATAANDWSAMLVADAQAFYELQSANHPGPSNPLDPEFTERMDAALALALERAPAVTTGAGYYYAMRQFAASFDDGHVALDSDSSILPPPVWPGFIAILRDGKMRVAEALPDAPPVGATLVDCDGLATDALLAANVAPFSGRWMLTAQQERRSPVLFIDRSNPWITRPGTCRFETADGVSEWVLNWQAAPDDLDDRVNAANANYTTRTEARPFGEGLWLSAGSFDGMMGEPGTEALEALVSAAAPARTAPVVVLDVRGNGGGNSEWGHLLARAVWGDEAVDAAAAYVDATEVVTWRASAGNLAYVEDFCAPALESTDPAMEEFAFYCNLFIDGFKETIAGGSDLWVQPKEPVEGPTERPTPDSSRRIFFLADGACASACLDTADLWLALGAVPIGRETNADTFYMDIRYEDLPSGLNTGAVPMKVYSGRLRGSNMPVIPAHVFPGDMSDTAAIEAWIATLD